MGISLLPYSCKTAPAFRSPSRCRVRTVSNPALMCDAGTVKHLPRHKRRVACRLSGCSREMQDNEVGEGASIKETTTWTHIELWKLLAVWIIFHSLVCFRGLVFRHCRLRFFVQIVISFFCVQVWRGLCNTMKPIYCYVTWNGLGMYGRLRVEINPPESLWELEVHDE